MIDDVDCMWCHRPMDDEAQMFCSKDCEGAYAEEQASRYFLEEAMYANQLGNR